MDLTPVFIEPKTTVAGLPPNASAEPTVGGLTGEQLSLLRQWEDERQCDFEDELGRRCPDDKAPGSRFCDFHAPEYDDFDVWMDYRNYED